MVEEKENKTFHPEGFYSIAYSQTRNDYNVLSQSICVSTKGN